MTYAVVCIGNATIDAFLSIHDANTSCRVDETNHDFCVRFGDKIDVDSCSFCVGGNAANVSVGLSRLGIKTALLAEIGDDEFSSKIIQTLNHENVGSNLILQTKHAKSSFSMGINFKNDRTLFVQHVKREHKFNFDQLKGSDAIYLTSLGHEWEAPYTKALDFVTRSQAKLLFNPGSLQLHEGKDVVKKLLEKTYILFVNKEEAELLLTGQEAKEKNDSSSYIIHLMEELHNKGPQIIVLTNGNLGSFARDTDGTVLTQQIEPAVVVERTGAGDSYTAGCIAALISGYTLKDALLWGAFNAAAVVGKVGAQDGLLTKHDMLIKIGKDSVTTPSENHEENAGFSFASLFKTMFPQKQQKQQTIMEEKKPVGYNKDLIVLAFDHRGTFGEHLFNAPMTDLSSEQRESIKDFKNLIYEGFEQSLQKGVPKETAAILVDEEYGEAVLEKARSQGITTILTTEKTGQKMFDFQYGDQFGEHIVSHQPTFAKALIRYNPEQDEESKRYQQANLKRLSDFCHGNNFRFLLEPLVPATDGQLASVDGNQQRYDKELRPKLTLAMMKELQNVGIEVDVWKLEGFEAKEDYESIVQQAKIDGREHVGVVVLGRGAGEEKVEEWIKLGASVPGVIGFAVGRTIFWDAIVKFYKKELDREQAKEIISSHFVRLYHVFEEGRKV